MKKYSFDFRGEILVFNLKGISSKEGKKKKKRKRKGDKRKRKEKKNTPQRGCKEGRKGVY